MMRVMRRVTLLCILALTGLGGGAAYRGRSEPVSRGESDMPTPTIQQVLAAHTDEWMAMPGVVGAGIGQVEGAACIGVSPVRANMPDTLARVRKVRPVACGIGRHTSIVCTGYTTIHPVHCGV